MFWLTSKLIKLFTDIDNLLGMPKICLGNFRFEYRVGFTSLEMAHQMVIAKRDMYDVLNFSNIITIYKTKYIIFSLISPTSASVTHWQWQWHCPICHKPDACNFIQRMSSCITASVVTTTLLGLRKFVVKAIIFENSLRLCSR